MKHLLVLICVTLLLFMAAPVAPPASTAGEGETAVLGYGNVQEVAASALVLKEPPYNSLDFPYTCLQNDEATYDGATASTSRPGVETQQHTFTPHTYGNVGGHTAPNGGVRKFG